MTEEKQAGAPATGKTKREIALEAQREQQHFVAQKRNELLQALNELEDIGGQDDVAASLVAIVNAHPQGILQTALTRVLPEADAKLRQKLVDEGLIIQEKMKQTLLLRPAPPKTSPTPPAEMSSSAPTTLAHTQLPTIEAEVVG